MNYKCLLFSLSKSWGSTRSRKEFQSLNGNGGKAKDQTVIRGACFIFQARLKKDLIEREDLMKLQRINNSLN